MTILDDLDDAMRLFHAMYDWDAAYALNPSPEWKLYIDRFKTSGDMVMTTPPEVMVKWAKLCGVTPRPQVEDD